MSAPDNSQHVFASFRTWKAVTPGDGTKWNCSGIYVGGAGDIYVQGPNDAAATPFIAPAVGAVFPCCLQGGLITSSTTATNLVAVDW